MRNFLQMRKMTWAIVLAVVVAVVWVLATSFSLAVIGFSLGVLGLMWALWYFTEPLWRQGRGAHVRRAQAPVVAFTPVKSLVEPRPGRDGS